MQQDERWECISSRCAADGAVGMTVYGVRLHSPDGVWEWPDVSPSEAQVMRLIMRLQHERPERCHLEDIVRDFIVEQSL